LYEKLKINSSNNHKSLVINNDVQKALKNNKVLISLKSIIANQRHLKAVNLILLQNWFSVFSAPRNFSSHIFYNFYRRQYAIILSIT